MSTDISCKKIKCCFFSVGWLAECLQTTLCKHKHCYIKVKCAIPFIVQTGAKQTNTLKPGKKETLTNSKSSFDALVGPL